VNHNEANRLGSKGYDAQEESGLVTPLRATARGGFADDTNESIGYLLRDTSRRILSAMATELDPYELTLPQYFLLRELYAEQGLTQRELSSRVGVLEPTIVATLDALERSGLILRERSSTDRRKVSVMLTPAGLALRPTLLGFAATVLDRSLDGLGDDEIAALRTTLKRIKANLATP
jgi:DNA-binding MarR family transcriptional regulator